MIDANDVARALRAWVESQYVVPGSVFYMGLLEPQSSWKEKQGTIAAKFIIDDFLIVVSYQPPTWNIREPGQAAQES